MLLELFYLLSTIVVAYVAVPRLFSYFRGKTPQPENNKNKDAVESLSKTTQCEELVKKALVFYENKELEDALATINEAINIDSNQDGYYTIRGMIKFQLQEFKEAINDYNLALKINPNNESSQANMGICYHYINQYDDALICFNLAIQNATKSNNENGKMYAERAKVYIKLGNQNAAINDYKKAIKLKAEFEFCYDLVNAANINNGHIETIDITLLQEILNYLEVLEFGNRLVGVNSIDAYYFYHRGFLKHLLQDYSGAERDYQQAQNLGVNNNHLKNHLAIVREKLQEIASYPKLWKHLLSNMDNIESVKDQDCVVVVGENACGKSTFVNYMLQVPLKTINVNGIERVEAKNGALTEICHSAGSKTFYSRVVKAPNSNWNFLDCPGFNNTQDVSILIPSIISTKLAVDFARRIPSLILTIPYDAFLNGESLSIYNVLKSVAQFADFEANIQQSLVVVITMAPQEAKIEVVKTRLNKLYQDKTQELQQKLKDLPVRSTKSDLARKVSLECQFLDNQCLLLDLIQKSTIIIADVLDNGETRHRVNEAILQSKSIPKSAFEFVWGESIGHIFKDIVVFDTAAECVGALMKCLEKKQLVAKNQAQYSDLSHLKLLSKLNQEEKMLKSEVEKQIQLQQQCEQSLAKYKANQLEMIDKVSHDDLPYDSNPIETVEIISCVNATVFHQMISADNTMYKAEIVRTGQEKPELKIRFGIKLVDKKENQLYIKICEDQIEAIKAKIVRLIQSLKLLEVLFKKQKDHPDQVSREELKKIYQEIQGQDLKYFQEKQNEFTANAQLVEKNKPKWQLLMKLLPILPNTSSLLEAFSNLMQTHMEASQTSKVAIVNHPSATSSSSKSLTNSLSPDQDKSNAQKIDKYKFCQIAQNSKRGIKKKK